MAAKIEDYALVGDLHTAALVSRSGSIDWLCLPRFDSPSTFGALLGTQDHGYWSVAPVGEVTSSSRRYVEDTFVLETTWRTPDGVVEVVDLMTLHNRRADVVRRVRGVQGTVRMRQELAIRFGYATAVPWVRRVTDDQGNEGVLAVAGPDAVLLRGGPLPRPDGDRHVGEFDVDADEVVDLTLTWYPAHRGLPAALEVTEEIESTRRWWNEWSARSHCDGPYEQHVRRSLLVLRALTHEDTGGIVAAVTTSLPEDFGGTRNWDYRYCWLRDAALTLEALLIHGYSEEALTWRAWLLRAIAGDPQDIQIMYGLAGERELPERVLPQFPGYEGSTPVRIGNGAVGQYQADVIGEVMVALESARRAGATENDFSWPLQRVLLDMLTESWQRPDHGIWEIRGPVRHFTHSRVMVWAALDRGVRAVAEHGLDGPADRWAEVRDLVVQEIEEHGFDRERNTYTQYFGGSGVDASLLVLAQVGYCAYDDPRMLGTVAAIESELMRDGLPLRYLTHDDVDGLPPGEHPFLACAFWLVEQYARSDRVDEARALMDRLVGLANDVGLLSEEYDVEGDRQAGNTPQAFSHLALVRAADALDVARRADDDGGGRTL